MTGPAIRGRRVTLRPLSSGDGPALDRILKDRSATRYLPPRVQRESGPRFVSRVLREARHGHSVSFAIFIPETTEAIGQVRLIDWSRLEQRAEVGIWLSRSYWGRGFGTEAVDLVCRFGFRSLRLHRISASVVVGNDSSERMLQKVGFRREGRLREAARVGRAWADVTVYGITLVDLSASRKSKRGRAGIRTR